METKERNNSKGIIIAVLLVAIVVMSIGYAALTQKLQINGTAEITSEWDVKITGIQVKEKNGTAVEASPATSDGTTATFDVQFTSPGDSITYDVTVTNSGSLDAVLASIVSTPQVDGSPDIIYTVTGVTSGNTEISADGGTNVVTVKAEFNPNATTVPTVKTRSLTVDLEYVQK